MTIPILTASVVGLEAYRVQVEADVSPGLPAFVVVGLPDAAVQEARERVRSAMVGCRLQDCGAWEYAETAWSPIGDACAWAERDARGVSPPTRGLLRWLRDS